VTASVLTVPITRTPVTLSLTYEDVSFCSRIDNVGLKGWYIPGGDKGTVVVVHGGKQNRADASMKLLELCCDLAGRGFNVLTFDRRACGESEVPKANYRARFERDVGGAYDYIRQRNGQPDRIFLLGISLGAAAVVVFSAGEDGINGIVSDSCFADMREMTQRVLNKVNKILPWFVAGALWLGKAIYGLQLSSVTDCIKRVTCPIFFIHGEADPDIPATDSVRLFKVAKNRLSELWVVPGALHGQSYSTAPSPYIDKVATFFAGKCA